MPSEHIGPLTIVDRNGVEHQAEIRVMTGTDMDIDTAITTRITTQLGIFNYITGQEFLVVDLTNEAREEIRKALVTAALN